MLIRQYANPVAPSMKRPNNRDRECSAIYQIEHQVVFHHRHTNTEACQIFIVNISIEFRHHLQRCDLVVEAIQQILRCIRLTQFHRDISCGGADVCLGFICHAHLIAFHFATPS